MSLKIKSNFLKEENLEFEDNILLRLPQDIAGRMNYYLDNNPKEIENSMKINFSPSNNPKDKRRVIVEFDKEEVECILADLPHEVCVLNKVANENHVVESESFIKHAIIPSSCRNIINDDYSLQSGIAAPMYKINDTKYQPPFDKKLRTDNDDESKSNILTDFKITPDNVEFTFVRIRDKNAPLDNEAVWKEVMALYNKKIGKKPEDSDSDSDSSSDSSDSDKSDKENADVVYNHVITAMQEMQEIEEIEEMSSSDDSDSDDDDSKDDDSKDDDSKDDDDNKDEDSD